jgi:hypothetical protein
MATDIKAIKDLVVCSYYGTSPNPTKFSNNDVKEALHNEIHNLCYDYNSYRRNKLDLFEILQEAYDEILPRYVEQIMGTFAEIKTVALGQKALFVRKRGRQRAKQFITEVGLSGAYESFRLDKDTFEVGGHAIGGAAYIDFERYLTGDEDISESTDILLEGIQEALMGEVQKALIASVNAEDRPTKNVYVGAGWDANAMASLISVARAYGGGAVIFAAPEFIAEMGPDAIGQPIFKGTPGYAGATPVYSPKDIDDIARTGYITSFRGTPIIQLPQSYTDETNTTTQINPAMAYVFPTGGERVVKVVFEGNTQVDDWQHRDRNFEIEAYTRFGVAILTNHNWCVYENTTLANTENYPTKYPVE